MIERQYISFDDLKDRYARIEFDKLTEPQQLFYELMEPLWVEKHRRTGKARYLCKMHFLGWLQLKLGQPGPPMKLFRDYSNDDIAKALDVCEPLLEKINQTT